MDANGGPERCHQLRGRDLYPGHVAQEQDPGPARPSQGSDEFEIVRARREDEGLLVVVQDEGHWRSPSRTDQRGRGLTVMRSLVDEVVIAPSPSGTTVFLRRRLTYAP